MERYCTETGARPPDEMFAMVQNWLSTAAKQGAALAHPSAARQAPAQKPAAAFPPRTILVGNEDDDYRALVKHLLTVNHYKVLEAVNATEVLSVINAQHPDLALVDLGMPKMNSYEFLRELRGNCDTRKVRVILFTGAADPGRLRALNMDISALLEKPVPNAKLLESISNAFGTARAAVRTGVKTAAAPAEVPDKGTDDGVIAGKDSAPDKNERRAIARAIALLEEAERRPAGTYASLLEATRFKEPRRLQPASLPAAHDLRPTPASASAPGMMKTAGTKRDGNENRLRPSDKPRPITKEAAEVKKDAKGQKMAVQASKNNILMTLGKSAENGGKTAFIATLIFFESIALGGFGYFVLGSDVKSGKITASTAFKPVENASAPAAGQPTVQQPQGSQPGPQSAERTAAAPENPANEKTSKALKIVKEYKLAGGRGTIESWFNNSFLSVGAGEEWTATPLQGDILVVQYRLIRPGQQAPLVYQFEVDAAKSDIVRGINNSAIELLYLPSKKAIPGALPVKKQAVKPAAKRTAARPKGVPMLPRPKDTDVKQGSEAASSGFARPEKNKMGKYLQAQESDEDLF